MTTASLDDQDLSTEEALSLVAEGATSLILVKGEVSSETFDMAFEACHPKPVKVGVYNTSEGVVQSVAHTLALLRVGPRIKDVQPYITVVMSDRLVFFGARVRTSTRKPMMLSETYNVLMPFDGHSLNSSVAKATPERREIIEWLIGGGERPLSAMDFSRLRTYPRARSVTVFIAGLTSGLALLRPGLGLTEPLAVAALIGAFALHLNLQTLREKFGVAHV